MLAELQLLEEQIRQLDQEMASLLSQHQDAVERLAEVPGLGLDSAQQIIAELGARAATFPSEKQLSSWVGACSGDDESAGVNYSHRSPTGIARCGGLLNQAANAAVKAKGSIFEIVYCRTLRRLGHNQAIGAIAHRLGRLIWKILYQRVHHEEPGPAVSKRPKQKRCANDPRTPKRRLSRRTRKSSTGKCRMSAGIFDPVSAFPASCPFRSNMTPPRGLLPRRPHRADFPQRVPQVGLSGYAQGCRIFGGSRGYRRRSAVYLSHVIRFPHVRRLSHFLQIRTTPR